MAPRNDPEAIREQKRQFRRQALEQRASQVNPDEVSREIIQRLTELPEFVAAETVMFYVNRKSEVRTGPYLPIALASGRKVVVPFCAGDDLGLFHLESLEELSLGAFEILEPKQELRTIRSKPVRIEEIDFAVVPGVAFDRHGGRLGHGKAYYDKLLAAARPDAPLVAVAFECQVFDEIPKEPHDVLMDKIVTEAAIYESSQRRYSK